MMIITVTRNFITSPLQQRIFRAFCGTPEARNSKTAEEWAAPVFNRFCFFADGYESMPGRVETKALVVFPKVAKEVKEICPILPHGFCSRTFYSEFAKYHFEGDARPFRAMYLETGFFPSAETEAGPDRLT